MPVKSPPSKTCSNCNRSQLSSPFCPACGAPTYTPSRGENDPAPPPAPRPVDSFPPVAPPPSRKTPGWVKVLAVIGGLFVTMIVGCAALVGSAANENSNTNGGNSTQTFSPSKGDGAADSPSGHGSTFKNGALTTPDVKFKITRYKVIGAGQKGNAYGKKPIITFWYQTTNLSGAEVNPSYFYENFSAYQDNNPNSENTLDLGDYSNDRFLHSDLENIKKGGTVESVAAYELGDLDTPVDLVADDGLKVSGKATYKLR